MSSNYALGSRLEAFVKRLVESGRYHDANEVLCDALRLLEDREKARATRIAELRALAEEGRLSGFSAEDGEAFLDRLEAKYRSRAERYHAP